MTWKELLPTCEQLDIDFKEHDKLTIESEQKELGPRELALLESGDNPQKRVQMYKALRSQLQLFSNRTKLAFYVVESTFQLLHRHVEFYSNGHAYQEGEFKSLISNLEHLLRGKFSWVSSLSCSVPDPESKHDDDDMGDVTSLQLFGKPKQEQYQVFNNDPITGRFLPRSAWRPYHPTPSRSPIAPQQAKSKFPFDVDLRFMRELLRKFKHSVSAGEYQITSPFVGYN